jgi:phosphohistidine phosphatase
LGVVRRLYLLRHAKSSWELAGERDHERGLTPRGRDDVALISKFMRKSKIAPDLVICSSARRTTETLGGLDKTIVKHAKIQLTEDAYRASVADLLDLLRTIRPRHRSVLFVGHNPAIHDLAVDLARGGDDLQRMATKFQTAGLAEFAFDGGWSRLGPDGAELVAFTAPKQLR